MDGITLKTSEVFKTSQVWIRKSPPKQKKLLKKEAFFHK
jgi:hypothetical protein